MRRMQGIEIMDQPWCPVFLRDAMTDYLQHVLNVANPYRPVAGKLIHALKCAEAKRILDLGSGAGGPWLRLQKTLQEEGATPPVLLTDYYPNAEAFRQIEAASEGIQTYPESVDATKVPAVLDGFRTMFSSFHHFPPEQAQAILQDAVNNGQGIGIFELTQRKPGPTLSMLLVPLFVLIMTPFIRPFRLSRLVFTYLLPVIPLATAIDGIVSCLRTYTPQELRQMTASLTGQAYTWEAGEERLQGAPGVITYLIGYPARTNSEQTPGNQAS